MTECGDSKDNAQAERIINRMKYELLTGMHFRSVKDVEAAVSKALSFYHKERQHMNIGMMTLHEAAFYEGKLAKN